MNFYRRGQPIFLCFSVPLKLKEFFFCEIDQESFRPSSLENQEDLKKTHEEIVINTGLWDKSEGLLKRSIFDELVSKEMEKYFANHFEIGNLILIKIFNL